MSKTSCERAGLRRARHGRGQCSGCQSRSGQCSGGPVCSEALIAPLKLEIEKLRREIYGTRSERKARLLEQMELQLEDLEAAATEDELAAENAAARTQTVQSFQRKRPSRVVSRIFRTFGQATASVCVTSG